MPPVVVFTPYAFIGAASFSILTGILLSHHIVENTDTSGLNTLSLSVLFAGGVITTGYSLGYAVVEVGMHLLGVALLGVSLLIIIWLGVEFREFLTNSVAELRALLEN